MKKQTLKTAIALTLATASLPVLAEVTLYDYTEANSAYEDAYLSGSANLSKSRTDKQAAYDLKLDADYEKVFSTPKRDTTLEFTGNGLVTRAGTEGAESADSYTAGAAATIDTYFEEGSKGAFWFGKASVGADSEQDDLATALTVGLGYGRVTNVTPMAKAIRLVNSLAEQGSISSKPSKAVHNEIAKIISVESEYQSKHGAKPKYYQKHWIGDIEKVLRGSGVLSGNLSATGILQARDTLIDERISTRKIGWKVRAGLSYIGTNFEGIKNKPGLELGAEYHHPISNSTQFSNEAVINTIFDSDASNAYTLKNRMSLTHEVDDRIDWENSWTLDYKKLDGGADQTINTLSSTFLYELSNSLDYTVSAQVSNTDGTANDGTDRSLNMGIRYRLK